MTATTQPLAGKVALVTGAGQNIGRAIALRLARDGAKVVVNGRSNHALVEQVVSDIRARDGEAYPAMADVSVPQQVEAMMNNIVAECGGLDIVVSNAGLRRQTPLRSMSFAEWREILSVALDGAFLVARHSIEHMISRGGGSMVAISGISHRVGTPERCHVSASKAGLEGLMRSLAIELAAHGVRCNCVSPGAIDTVRGASAGVRPPSRSGADTIALRRMGDVEEIADTVAFLVSPGAGYITGQTLHVNGGAFLG